MAWTLIKSAEPNDVFADHKEWMIDAKADASTLPSFVGAPGSIVYTPDLKNIYMVNTSGTLTTIQEES